jgi:FlaA1/EpsC-like NDP-sugar epimerase
MARALHPEFDLAIEFTGLRPGDKETELLWSPDSRTSPVHFAGLVSIETAQPAPAQFAARLRSLRTALEARNLAQALAQLRAMVPDYTPSRAVQALAHQSSPQVCV